VEAVVEAFMVAAVAGSTVVEAAVTAAVAVTDKTYD
jgi:hypothetical protein